MIKSTSSNKVSSKVIFVRPSKQIGRLVYNICKHQHIIKTNEKKLSYFNSQLI